MKTLQEAAKAALDVQNASNLSGVIYSFEKALKVLREDPSCQGTDWVNKHPIAILFAAQIANLTGVAVIASEECNYGKCYWICKELSTGEQHQVEQTHGA